MTPIPLNQSAPTERQYVLTLNRVGKHVVEPAVQEPGFHDSIDAEIFMRDLYSDYPDEAKRGLRKALGRDR